MDKKFEPQLTPKEMLKLGIFGGYYFEGKHNEYPKDWFTDGEEIVLYSDNEDLFKKINYYLKFDDERIRISINGYKRVTQEHRFKHRVEKLLNFVDGL